jgi:hypothetical protein
MNDSNLSRWAGLSAMGSGMLFIGIQAIHPSDVLSSVTTDRWVVVHCIGVAMGVLGLFGVAGIYARQVKETGWLGLCGWLLFSLFYALTTAFQFAEAFITPKLVSTAPEYVNGFLAIAAGDSSKADMGALPAIYAATGGLYVAGGALLGIATFRAGVLARSAGGLLALGAVLPLAAAPVPHPLDRIFAVPMGLALAWLGYSLWTHRRRNAEVPVPGIERSRLRTAGAE